MKRKPRRGWVWLVVAETADLGGLLRAARLATGFLLVMALAACNLPQHGGAGVTQPTGDAQPPARSESAAVTATVGSTPTPTPTLTATATRTFTPTPTDTPTASFTPSPSMTATLTPSATAKGGRSFAPQAAPDAFYTAGCTPDRIEIAVKVDPAADVANVFMFFQLEDQSGGSSTGWGDAVAMGKTASGTFGYTLLAARIPGAGNYASATLLVQFVAMNAGGTILARSSVYAAATLARCGTKPPGGMIPIRPGITLIPHLIPTTPVPIVR